MLSNSIDPLATAVVLVPEVNFKPATVVLPALVVIYLLVSDSVPAKVAKVPVVGNVTDVLAVEFKVVVKDPDVVRLPPIVMVLPVLATPVPPY